MALDTFGQNLRTLRQARGLSQDRLGALAGLSGRSVRSWEADAAKPRHGALAALAAALGVPVAALLPPGAL